MANLTDSIAPLCPCGGVCVPRERRRTLNDPHAPPLVLAVCLRCERVRGAWSVVMKECLDDRGWGVG